MDEDSSDGHTHILLTSTGQKQPPRSELTRQQGRAANRLSERSPHARALHAQPRPSNKKLFQSEQKQSICLKLNNKQVSYLPCWFALSSSCCKVWQFHLPSLIKARTI